MSETPAVPNHFIRQIVREDLAQGKHREIVTRFPPEPNGYLHIGHAKSICLNFGLAEEFSGRCYLRFDDTNPLKEDLAYVRAIQGDVRWLGFDWGERLTHASDYFEQLYQYALDLIRAGKAYVDSQTPEEIRANRGTLTEPGVDSPHRERSVAENLELFTAMRAGAFADGTHVLRAKIDMASANFNLRDPVLYRIRHATHQNTGDAWPIYPLYDFTHGLCDALEGVTHSLCTLEFEGHRPLYDWFLDQLDVPCQPRQIEFSRLNLNYTVLSKRKLNQLVVEGHVDGWDDPRMMTLSGLRRRGYTPEALRDFCERIGITKKETVIEMGLLETCLREDLDHRAARVMGVLDPVKLVITNYPADQVEHMTSANHPQRPELGQRSLPFARELWIEREDFREEAPKKFFRLVPGREVRLRNAYIVKCTGCVKDAQGQVVEVHCEYDPATRSGSGVDAERKVKGTIHWVSAAHALDAEVRLWDRLFKVPFPDSGEGSFIDHLNPEAKVVLRGAKVEPSLADAPPEARFQFERQGYFCVDGIDSRPGQLVFNRTVTLRDSWAKIEQQQRAG